MRIALVAICMLLTLAPAASAIRLDAQFGDDGTAQTVVGAAFAGTFDGGIVAVGGLGTWDHQRIVVQRLTHQGKPAAFGNRGVVETQIGSHAVASVVAADPDGSIVVAGTTATSDPYHSVLVLVRYLADGRLDPRFGTDGILRLEHIKTSGIASQLKVALTIARSRRILVGVDPFTVFALRQDGTVDPTFGRNGVATPLTDLGHKEGGSEITRITELPDGSLGVLGQERWEYGDSYSTSRALVVRLSGAGVADPQFGVARSGFVQGTDFAVTPERVVVSGHSCGFFKDPFGGACDSQLTAFDSSGKLDPGFGANGTLTIFGLQGTPNSIARLPNDQLLMAGYAVARAHSDGQPDTRFGDCGGTPVKGLSQVSRLIVRPGRGYFAVGVLSREREGDPAAAIGILRDLTAASSRFAAPTRVPFVYFDEDEDNTLASLQKRSFRIPAYLGQNASVTVNVDLLGLGDFDYVPLTRKLRRRLGLQTALAHGSAHIRACDRSAKVTVRFDPRASRALLRQHRGPWRLRMRIEARNRRGMKRGSQPLTLSRTGGITT